MSYMQSLTSFVMSLIVSGLVIYFVTMVLSRGRGIMTAILTALVGSVIYALAPILPTAFLSTVVAGIAWLLAIGHFYSVGWLKALLLAVVIWFVTGVVSSFLPTLGGPI